MSDFPKHCKKELPSGKRCGDYDENGIYLCLDCGSKVKNCIDQEEPKDNSAVKIKCSWRNCKEAGHYVHTIERDNVQDCQHKGYFRSINRIYCVYHHRIIKDREIKKNQRKEDDF